MATPGEFLTTLTAAATRFTSRMLGNQQKTPDSTWQERAWENYSTTPEVRFAATWIGNAMSGARLIAGRRDADGNIEPAPAGHRAAELVAGIAGGPTGQSQLLGAFGPHLVVAGEGWIVIRPNSDQPADTKRPDRQDWQVLSVLEVKKQGGKLVAEIDGQDVPIPAADPDKKSPPSGRDADPIAIRVWNPHPRRRLEADSPVRSALGLLQELHLLNNAVAAITRSRLTGRGVLLVPHGTRFLSSGEPGQDEDDLIEVFMEVASTAYREPESAAATVPIVLEVPAESIATIKRLTFESDFDRLAIDLREEAIRRFATGLEIPPEILLGTGSVNHWGQWGLQEEAIRLGIEPPLATVADALTTQWLRPILQEEDAPDADEWLVWYDTAPLRVRQNRSQIALDAYKLGVIGGTAARRETGFEESDAPTPQEAAARRAELAEARRRDNTDDAELPVGDSTALPDTQPAGTAPAAEPGIGGMTGHPIGHLDGGPDGEGRALKPGIYMPTPGNGTWRPSPRCFPGAPTGCPDPTRPETCWRASMPVATRDGARVTGGIPVCYVCGWSPYTDDTPPSRPSVPEEGRGCG